ncbi:MAG: hypothetical protein LBE92_20400 [Chryseobacterium sp.]|jgi:hypothetical protein|uniref:hypothetical protein n=1 Tax=Chryseobacterium sp. TaxID=1871047 RepID=UPI00282362FE|nr:hypothetical protein [Chryseobacterium sp.]MDR2238496.1 hypothetical protein [Chryseobacterium sp.]
MNNSEIEQIFNRTFAGLTLFYRDTDLRDELLSKYHPGQILHERGFVDVTYKGGGLTGNTRFLIASANGRDLSALYSENQSPGHILLRAGSYFKVLDISKSEGKTQIFLLDIPADALDFFEKSTSNIEEQIVEKAKENFPPKYRLIRFLN